MNLPKFPEFRELTIDDRDGFTEITSHFPPLSNLSFASIQIWNNQDNKLLISSLNNNLIINYQLTFDEINTGLSILGKNLLDETIETVLDYLRHSGKHVELIHIPEFVIEKIKHPDLFTIEEELDYNEYIIDAQAITELKGKHYKSIRGSINKFKREVDMSKVELKALDLSSQEAKDQLLDAILEWEKYNKSNNDPGHTEHQALSLTLKHLEKLDIHHLGLYINGKLSAIVFYHHSHDKKYYILNHIKIDYTLPYLFDFITHHLAGKALENNIKYLNMEMDLGIEGLRQHKNRLVPVGFFRQFRIKPKS